MTAVGPKPKFSFALSGCTEFSEAALRLMLLCAQRGSHRYSAVSPRRRPAQYERRRAEQCATSHTEEFSPTVYIGRAISKRPC